MKFLKHCIIGSVLFWSFVASISAQTIDFELPDINGKKHKLSDFRGKWVVVNYWATWCPPCAHEIPELNKFHEKYKKKNAVVIGMNFEFADKKYVQEFMTEYDFKYPVLLTQESIGTPFGQLVGLPTTYLVSPAGELVTSHMGAVTLDVLETWLAK